MEETTAQTQEQIQLASYFYRGQIVGDLIYLERLIDEIIAQHLCETREKQVEIFELILGNERMGFSNKIQVFEYIIKTYRQSLFTLNPKIFADLKNLNAERNIVAHYLLDTSENGIKVFEQNRSIGFVKFRNSTTTIWRTDAQKSDFNALLGKYISLLGELLVSIQN